MPETPETPARPIPPVNPMFPTAGAVLGLICWVAMAKYGEYGKLRDWAFLAMPAGGVVGWHIAKMQLPNFVLDPGDRFWVGTAWALAVVLGFASLDATGQLLGMQQRWDCMDFASQAEAQDHLTSRAGDYDGLDRDHDGVACEGTPADAFIGSPGVSGGEGYPYR